MAANSSRVIAGAATGFLRATAPMGSGRDWTSTRAERLIGGKSIGPTLGIADSYSGGREYCRDQRAPAQMKASLGEYTIWQLRQTEMEQWYQHHYCWNEHAPEWLRAEYEPYADLLARLQGVVLDVGGGAGFAARFMGRDSGYVVVDPSSLMVTAALASGLRANRAFRSHADLRARCREKLPFRCHCFDAVLAF